MRIEVEIPMSDSTLGVEITYRFVPGERPVMYYADGSGYPGSPPMAELNHVHVYERVDRNGQSHSRKDHNIWLLMDKWAEYIVQRDWDHYEQLCLEDHEEN